MFCEKCGAQLEDGARFCQTCGSPCGPEIETTEKKPPKAKKKGWKIFIFILVGVIVLGAAAYFGVVQWMYSKNYKDAVSLMDSGKYAYAYDLFVSLGDYKDSAQLAVECDNEIDYQAAAEAFSAGQYYTAYQAFDALKDYKDSADLKEQCIQADPANGLTYFNAAYASSAVTFTVSTGYNSGYDTYLKFYTSGGELVACVFIAPNSNVTYTMLAGQYKINKAMGTIWYGTEEMFGESGTYAKVMFDNDTTDIITLQTNHIYTLTFDVADASGDDVGDESVDMNDF